MPDTTDAPDVWLSDWRAHNFEFSIQLVDEVYVVAPSHGVMRPTAKPPDGPPPDGRSIRVETQTSGTELIVAGQWPKGTEFNLYGCRWRLNRGRDAVSDVVFQSGSTVIGPGHVEIGNLVICDSVVFKRGEIPINATKPSAGLVDVTLNPKAYLMNVSGNVARLTVSEGSVAKGHGETEFRPTSIRFPPPEDIEQVELDHVSLFGVSWESLVPLEGTSRLIPWLPVNISRGFAPIDRKDARRRALAMETGVNDPAVASRRRAQFWSRVADTMKRQGAGGSEYAAVRELAYQTRLAAVSRGRAEWWWLWFARLFGFGTRIGRPILIWLAVAAVSTGLLWFLVRGDSNLSVNGWLFLDVLTSPTAFLHPQEWDDLLTDVVNAAGGPARFIMAMVRVIGTTAAIFAAVAISIHTRLSGIGRSEV